MDLCYSRSLVSHLYQVEWWPTPALAFSRAGEGLAAVAQGLSNRQVALLHCVPCLCSQNCIHSTTGCWNFSVEMAFTNKGPFSSPPMSSLSPLSLGLFSSCASSRSDKGVIVLRDGHEDNGTWVCVGSWGLVFLWVWLYFCYFRRFSLP